MPNQLQKYGPCDPNPHKTTHQDGGSDEISVAGLAGRQVFIPYNAFIAAINETNTNKHTLNLETALSETRKIVAVILGAFRSAGTGALLYYPNEGLYFLGAHFQGFESSTVIIKDATQRLQYSQTIANDVFALVCWGYVVVTS